MKGKESNRGCQGVLPVHRNCSFSLAQTVIPFSLIYALSLSQVRTIKENLPGYFKVKDMNGADFHNYSSAFFFFCQMNYLVFLLSQTE